MKDYYIIVFFSDTDGCYFADIPDLEYCLAFGDSPEEAVKEVMIAKEAWIGVAKEKGVSIPEPKYKPAIYQAT